MALQRPPIRLTRISKLSQVPPSPTSSTTALSLPLLGNAAGDSKTPEVQTESPQDSDEVVQLKEKITELEERYNELRFINERSNIDLAHERHKVGQLERKLKFIKDNQHIFEKLKEAYVSMKYNQSTAGRKLVEIRDKEVQTWDGILCRSCWDTENLRIELDQLKSTYNGCILITQEQMEKLNDTLSKLKACLNASDDIRTPSLEQLLEQSSTAKSQSLLPPSTDEDQNTDWKTVSSEESDEAINKQSSDVDHRFRSHLSRILKYKQKLRSLSLERRKKLNVENKKHSSGSVVDVNC